ncbi:MAG TPA: hypothetical protein PKE29_14665 [Phycisphaerales bacterium]|nr:hypothetical protein [Phycisphaerales bacterium]
MHLLTLAQDQHNYGFEGRLSEAIFIACVAAMVLVALFLAKLSFRNWIIAAILFTSCLAPSVDTVLERYNPTWMFIVQLKHADLHLALGIFLTILVVVAGDMNVRYASAQGALLFGLAIYVGLLQFYHEDTQTALEAIGFALATIPCFMFAAGRSAKSLEGVSGLIRTIMWVSVAWTVCCSVQFVLNPRYLVNWNGRFHGMLGNAQHVAAMVAPFAIIAVWLFLHDPQKRRRILWVAIFAVNLLFLVWTGSRTGGLMFVLGLSLVLYTRIGNAVLLMPIGVLLVWGLSYLADALQISSNLQRFISTENTREGVLSGQIRAALENPILGAGWRSGTVGTENSYLGALGAYGIICFFIILCLLGVSVWQCTRFNLQKRWLDRERRAVVDLFTAFMAMFFAGAVFEGYMLARSFIPLLMLLIFSAIGVWIRDEIAASQAASEQARLDHDEYEDPELSPAHE